MKKFFLVLFLVVLGPVIADDAPDKPIFLFEHDPTLLTTTIEIDVRSGSLADPNGKGGLANFVADLILRGTKKKSRTEFQQTMERLGGTLGGSASSEAIYLGGEVIKENTMPFLDLLEEAITQPAFSEKEFASLKREILAGISHAKNSNASLGGLALRRYLFKGTSMETPVLGSLTSVKGITRQNVLDRYKQAFHQGNILVAVDSPIPEYEIRTRLEKIWSQLPAGTRKPSVPVPVPNRSKPEIIIVNKPKTSTGSLLAALPGITANDPDRYALQLGNFSFGGEPLVSRLFTTVRSKLGWTYSVGSTYQALGGLSFQQGLFMVFSTPSVEFTGKALLKILEMWDEYKEKGLLPDEIKLAQESSINSYPFAFDTASKRLGMRVASTLYGVPILNPEQYTKTVNDINNETIIKDLQKHHGNEHWTISIVADAAEIKKQLDAEQASIPKEKRLTVTKVFTPEEVIR